MPINSLLIAVPTMGGIMKAATADTLIKLMKVLTRAGIDADYRNIDSSDIVIARNLYANAVLESKKWQALLFIDSDMSFLPRLVLKMLKLDAPAVAAAYLKRGLDWNKFGEALRTHGDLDKARAASSEFTLKPSWGSGKGKNNVKRRGGFVTMAAAGMGCSLIAKSVLTEMVEAGVVGKRRDGSGATPLYGFFDPIEVDGQLFSEDYSFWYRWTATMGRELWVCADEEVSHIGQFGYQAKLSSLLDMKPLAPEI